MKLFYCYTASHEGLVNEYFLPTLPRSFEPHPIFSSVHGTGDYLSPDFIACVTFKITQILARLEQPDGEIVVWSDVDILFFADPVAELQRLFAEENVDLLVQAEDPLGREVNTGFLAYRATAPVRELFREILLFMSKHPGVNEQFAANALLNGFPSLRWRCLPRTYYARTHGWPPPRDAVLYHANFTAGRDGVGQKMNQFEEIRWVRKWGTPALLWSCAKRAPGKLWRMATGTPLKPTT